MPQIRRHRRAARRDHLFLVDGKGARHVDCERRAPARTAASSLADIVDRTETAMPQAHCFLACRLALEAQAKAVRLGDGGAGARAARGPPAAVAAPRGRR